MRSSAATLVVLSVLGATTLAWDNTPPIPDRLPGAGLELGKGGASIDIEIIYDLGCPTCKAEHPEIMKLLDLPFLTGKVSDAITMRFAFSPLTWHHGAWTLTKMIPYMSDLCYFDATKCGLFKDYIAFAFAQQDWIIVSTKMSESALIANWTQTVATKMKLDVNELRNLYDNGKDTHKSERRTRDSYDYTMGRTVGGTPSAFVNGVKIQKIPANAQDWLKLITDVINSQTKLTMEEQQEMIRNYRFLE